MLFRSSYERVASVVDNVYVARAMAQKARDAGLDQDAAVQARMKQLQDGFLADLYVQKLEKEAEKPDLEKRARELYVADTASFLTDEEVSVHQILIGITCRTKQAARELARKAQAEAKAGGDFLAIAAKYNDEGEKAYKGGDVGTGPAKRLVASVREKLATMKKGEISEPVESQFGYHVLKLIDRKPAEKKPFDAVKQEIIATERAKLQKKRVEDAVAAVRNSTTVVTHRDNVEKLVVAPGGADTEELLRKAREAHKTAPENVQQVPKR